MRADRLLSLLMILQSHDKVTTAQLAREAGVSRRTILRDLDALSHAGVPVYTESGPGGGVALDEAYQMALSGLSAQDLPAIFVSGLPSLLSAVGMEKGAEDILLKLFAALPTVQREAVEQVRHRLHVDPQWWWHEEESLPFWDLLQEAVFEDRKIRVRYERHDGSMSERILEPYSLVSKAGIWYVVARRDDEWRTYRASRFQDVLLMAERFTRSVAFDLAEYWQEHVETTKRAMPHFDFVVRMPEAKAEFLRYHIPGNGSIRELDDADGWFRAEVKVPSQEWAKMLLFGLGAQAEVIAPVELHREIVDAAERIVEAAMQWRQ